MKKLLVFALLLLPVPTLAPQTRLAMYTAGLQNGRAWSLLDDFAKLAWVVGYGEGIQMAQVEAMRADDDKASALSCAARISTNLHYFATYAGNLTAEELAKGVEKFYQSAPENAPVPIVFALQFVALKASGATPSQLEEYASSLRKKASAGTI